MSLRGKKRAWMEKGRRKGEKSIVSTNFFNYKSVRKKLAGNSERYLPELVISAKE